MLRRPSSDPTTSKSPATPPVDGVIGSVSQTPAKSSSKQKSVSNTASNSSLRIHLALVKPQRSTLSSLPQWTNPRKVRRKAKARVKPMPQNRVLLNRLLVNLHNGNLSIHASFVRRITILRIVPDDLKLVVCSKGPQLS
jgi:hypothetical protein